MELNTKFVSGMGLYVGCNGFGFTYPCKSEADGIAWLTENSAEAERRIAKIASKMGDMQHYVATYGSEAE